jgi:2-polyprenyl-3-methyl-5-hydroxy-6-metoxy-1,4-benzoquinol methylase
MSNALMAPPGEKRAAARPRSYRERIVESYSVLVHNRTESVSDAAIARWSWPLNTYLRGWLPERRDAAILDVGCGYGRLLRYFALQGYENVIGIDASPQQVALAARIHGRVIQASAIPFLSANEGGFDLITAFDLIEHLPKDEVLEFLEAARVALRPGARLILKTLNANNPWSLGLRYGDFTHELAFTPKSLDSVLRLCGFGQAEFREMGPVAHNAVSLARVALWRAIRFGWATIDRVETGCWGQQIYTRDFFAAAKPL